MKYYIGRNYSVRTLLHGGKTLASCCLVLFAKALFSSIFIFPSKKNLQDFSSLCCVSLRMMWRYFRAYTQYEVVCKAEAGNSFLANNGDLLTIQEPKFSL